MLPGVYNNNMQLFQTPACVAIMNEMMHTIRITAPSTGTASPRSPSRAASAARACPSGCRLCGRALGEVDVLALAHAYEQATAWHERTPPL